MRLWTLTLCLALLTFGAPLLGAAPDADWPGFRGPAGDGTAPAEGVFDADSPGLGVAWTADLGSGYSGVSVAAGKAVTMFATGGSDWVVAFDAETGQELWRSKLGPTYPGHDGSHDGPISTPRIHDGRVHALGPHGHLVALDLETGETLWQTHLPEEHQASAPYYGFATCPLIQDGVLILEVAREEGTALAGFDPATGERLWTAGEDGVAYQSPMPFTLGDRRLVLATGNEKLFGLDPKTGEILWDLPHGGDRSAMGAQTLNPVPAGDGKLLLMHQGDQSKMVRLAPREDGGVALEDVWEDRSLRSSYNVPVYHDGHVYGYSGGFLTAVEAETGRSVWKSRQPGDGFVSLVDGHLVIVTKRGDLAVARATPEGYQEVARLPLFEEFAWTPPSFAGAKIYARSHGAVAAVEIRQGRATRMATRDTVPPPAPLARLLEQLETAPDKSKLVDRFVQEHGSPVVEDDRVAFVYHGEAQDLAYVGDLTGARHEEPMTRAPGTDLFYYVARMEPNAGVSYHYVRDFEETVTDPLNPRTVAASAEDQVSWWTMPDWQRPEVPAQLPEDAPQGRMETFELESEIFESKRKIQVWLPPGYDDHPKRRYPVAYVHGAEEALELGDTRTYLDHTMGKGHASSGLVVFIHQVPPGRGSEWFGPRKEGYARSLAEELVPEIDERFRTIPRAEARTSVGMGYAGYAAVGAALRQPETFGRIAGHSVFMLTTQREELTELARSLDADQPEVFLVWGRYDYRTAAEGWDIRDANQQLAKDMKAAGFTVHTRQTPDGWGWPSWRTRTADWVGVAWDPSKR